MAAIGVEAWVPDHLEVERSKLFGSFDETQVGVPLDHGAHAAGKGKDVVSARQAFKCDAKVRHADRRAAFEAKRGELFIGNGLRAGERGDSDVVGSEVLPEGEAIADGAGAGDRADPVFAIESFGLEVRGEKAVVDGKDEVELVVLEHFSSGGLPGDEVEGDAIARGNVAAAEAREQDGADVVWAGDAELAALATWVEDFGRDQGFHGWQQRFELL